MQRTLDCVRHSGSRRQRKKNCVVDTIRRNAHPTRTSSRLHTRSHYDRVPDRSRWGLYCPCKGSNSSLISCPKELTRCTRHTFFDIDFNVELH